MFNRLKSLFQPKSAVTDPFELFVVAFVEECKRQGRSPINYDHQSRFFVFDDPRKGHHTVYLDNAFSVWIERDAPGRAEHLTRFVRAMGEAEMKVTPADVQGKVVVGARARTLISDMLIANLREAIFSDTGTEIAWGPLCGDIAAVLMVDRPDTLRPVTHSDLANAGISFDQAMALAMSNLRAKVPAPAFEPHPDASGLFVCKNLEDHQSSLLLLTPGKDFQFAPLDGDPVALVPSRNMFFVTGSRNRSALSALLDIAGSAREQANHCSSNLLSWNNGRWEAFAFETGTDEATKQRLISMREIGLDYRGQKDALDRLQQDIFVSPFEAFQPDNRPGSEFSITFYPSGSKDTLLPVADRVSLIDQVINPKTGFAGAAARDRIVVAWADVMSIAGELFRPVEHLYPPRYRVRGFPDADAWKQLKTKAFE